MAVHLPPVLVPWHTPPNLALHRLSVELSETADLLEKARCSVIVTETTPGVTVIMAGIQVPKKKTSPIWEYFAVSEDQRFVTCLCEDCGQQISRGGKDLKTYGTTNLIYHFKTKHSSLSAEYEENVKKTNEAKEEERAKLRETRCPLDY